MDARRTGRWTVLLAAVLLAGTVCCAWSDGPADAPVDDVESQRVGGGDSTNATGWAGWGQMLAAMAVVVGLIFGLGWLLRRFGGPRAAARATGSLDVIGSTALTGKHQVHLVRMGGRVVLVGTSPTGVRRLAETDQETLARSVSAQNESPDRAGEVPR
jgi:flagellar biosynthetic protein FliO